MAKLSAGAVELKRWRERAELTQSEAASRLSIDPWYFSKIERGERKPGRALAVTMQERAGVGVGSWDQEPGVGTVESKAV